MTLLDPITFEDMEFANSLNVALDLYFEDHSTIEQWLFVDPLVTNQNQLYFEIERKE